MFTFSTPSVNIGKKAFFWSKNGLLEIEISERKPKNSGLMVIMKPVISQEMRLAYRDQSAVFCV